MKFCNHCMTQLNETSEICPKCGRVNGASDIPAHHLLPGTILNDKFYVGKALGEGGFGITYIGFDTRLDMKVAIKEFYPNGCVTRNHTVSSDVVDSTTDERKDFFLKGKTRFLQEAKMLAKFCDEPGIVGVRDFFEENNTAYIIMEFLDGITLKDHLKTNGLLSAEKTVELLMPVMMSLKKVHEQGMIHRDISPDNIMLVGNKVKLLDFGAARNVSANENKSLSIMLKPGYAPEEQYRSKGNQGPWTDIYALCATMYKCITGITPDDSTQRVYRDEVRKPSQLGVRIPAHYETVIMRGMSVHQESRFQNIDALISAFNQKEDSTVNVTENVGCTPSTSVTPVVHTVKADTPANFGGGQKDTLLPPQKPRKRVKPLAIIIPIVAVMLTVVIVLLTVVLPDVDTGKAEETTNKENEKITQTTEKVLTCNDFFISKNVLETYDEQGNVIWRSVYGYYAPNIISLNMQEGFGDSDFRDEYIRDDEGKVIKYIHQENDVETVYVFDYELQDDMYFASASSVENGSTVEYQYGYKNGVLVLENKYVDSIVEYSMLRERNIATECYYYNGSLGKTNTYEYDESGNIICKKYVHGENANYNTTTTYTYDENGNETSCICYDTKGNILSKTTSRYYSQYNLCIDQEEYDENGELTGSIKIREESESKIIIDYYTKDFNGEEQVICSELVIEDGKIVEEKFYVTLGGYFEGEGEIKYNEYGLATETIWYDEYGIIYMRANWEYAQK